MPGPVWESMWPAMTAAPVAPGRGLPVYQPATAAVDGTCSAPELVRPSRTSRDRTPIAGISIVVGLATGTVEFGRGTAAQGPFRGGIVGGGPTAAAGRAVWSAQMTPPAPAHAPSTPATASAV